MTQERPFVSIILPVYNEEQYLEQCLKKLSELSYPRDHYEVIVVDNGSTDSSMEIAQRYADQCLLIVDVNVGAVRNFGVKHASGSILTFLDSDCLVPSDWLDSGTERILNNPNHVYGGNLYLRQRPAWVEKYWLLDNENAPLRQKDLLGSCIFIQKQHFENASGFNESVTSGEDSELSLTLKSIGHTVVIDRALGVVHLGNPTNISGFLKRQIWHSENYLNKISSSLSDITFWLVAAYLVTIPGFLYLFVEQNIYTLSTAVLFLTLPTILSAKRVIRSQYKIDSALSLISIFLIDHLYLAGRSLGLVKSLFKLIKS